MNFLYPLFLIAGASLLIPILIHLFNLRKYKTIYFSNTRFLKSIQLTSQKQRTVRYKWLLLTRLLLLAFVILAFAQPFLLGNNAGRGERLQIIYLDNSQSMSAKAGARRLIDIAKTTALAKLRNAAPGERFYLITNEQDISYQSATAEHVADIIGTADISSQHRTAAQVLQQAADILDAEKATAADLYYYSDFQTDPLSAQDTAAYHGISLHGIAVQPESFGNVYIDTAWLLQPVLQSDEVNQLIVRTKQTGEASSNDIVLRLSVNGQVKAAQNPAFTEGVSQDTLSFSVGDGSWQQIALTTNDASMRFDDSFFIAGKSAGQLSVLLVNGSSPNPYMQTAFSAYKGFQLTQTNVGNIPADLDRYSLVILNDLKALPAADAEQIATAIQAGVSCCIFPARDADQRNLNGFLVLMGDLRLNGIDTASQTVSFLQQQSEFVKNLFEDIPENVQLPVANWHYDIVAGLNANQQSIMSFRDGAPFLARYTVGAGNLYMCSSSADITAGNFAGSYFFVPFLYQMSVAAKGSDIFAFTVGSSQPAHLLFPADERNIFHLSGNGLNLIPAQQAQGAGVDVFAGQAVKTAGFYVLANAGGDSVSIGMNNSRQESIQYYSSVQSIKNSWKGYPVAWIDIDKESGVEKSSYTSGFPLWKVCVILALFMLSAETFLLAATRKNKQTAPQ